MDETKTTLLVRFDKATSCYVWQMRTSDYYMVIAEEEGVLNSLAELDALIARADFPPNKYQLAYTRTVLPAA